MLLEVARHAGNRACSAHGADKVRHSPVGVLPNFGACCLKVHAWVVSICELIQHHALTFCAHLLCEITGVFHTAAFGRQYEFCAKGLHGLYPLNRQVFWHDQNHTVAFDGSSHGQRNAGVSRRGLNKRVARFDIAALLRALNHGQRGAVFHGARRVITL